MQSFSTDNLSTPNLPKIGITMGDPAGVGPELCVRVLNEPTIQEYCIPVVFGDSEVLCRVADKLQMPVTAPVINHSNWQAQRQDVLSPTIVDFGLVKAGDFESGKVDSACGRASLNYIYAAVMAAIAGELDAITTGPINKESIHAAGSKHIGHTELLAHVTDSPEHLMMLTSQEITCSLVTAHVGLQEAAKLLSIEKIVSAMRLTIDAMEKMRGITPKLTVCGLNPHAGEGGLLGNGEEEKFIAPAVAIMQSQGFDVTGPLPPDTAFLPARRHATDAYICMYHDQGLIPLKMLAFDNAINITLGLPIIRTSVDHGTAFDIAWKGIANPNSMFEAIRIAAMLCTKRKSSPSGMVSGQ
jgi:4-hydroxythreonine-4-phosphate dehydrogenase